MAIEAAKHGNKVIMSPTSHTILITPSNPQT